MNIDGLGEAVVKQLVENRLISTVADLYSLQQQDLEMLPGLCKGFGFKADCKYRKFKNEFS